MALSWNEIKSRAIQFSKEWSEESREHAEAKSFWDGFFHVFGITRRRIASFEEPVKKLDQKQGFIDLLWKGVILVEHKSRGKDLDTAYQQAKDYFPGLKEHELPRYILVSDFARFVLYDLEDATSVSFTLKDFVSHVHLFGFIAGYEKRTFKEEDAVNIEAAERMGQLHDQLEEIGYSGHVLEVYLVRLLFCLFADDTGIFEKGIFQEYIDQHTRKDGSDLAAHLSSIFQVLNTSVEKRLKNLDERLQQFPYVNGKLFEEILPHASFDSRMREMLLKASGLNWSRISPAIFGSMFQAVMNPVERRNLGAHYTSEKNILKLIKPLFLDDLYIQFEKAKKGSAKQREEFHRSLANFTFFDPACGCGNFLIITYRELRLLEIEILRELNKTGQLATSIEDLIWIDVDQFYGIEYDEFPVRVAEVAMWLMDHQMNMRVSEEFGQYFARLPLKKSATIVHGNALQQDWSEIIPKERLSFILGNPPFVGSKMMSPAQRQDILAATDNLHGVGVLDYVCAWYFKAAHYVQGTSIRCGFVSTNSITQGEQVGILWLELFHHYHIKIHFAHRTFRWYNEAAGRAAVYVVIIGFACYDISEKHLFEYEDIKGEPHVIKVSNINPYLIAGRDSVVVKRQKPICEVPEIKFGNMPLDGGNLLLSDEEKRELVGKEPQVEKYIRRVLGSREFLHNELRWCLWLLHANPAELRSMPEVMRRIEAVRKFREQSKAPSTRKFARTPSLFRDTHEYSSYILVPSVSSERRKYIPLGFFNSDTMGTNLVFMIPNASLFHFGILSSEMHMAWVKYVCGRLKSDFRYSKDIVYNNFPWPIEPSVKQQEGVKNAAQMVLDVRAQFVDSSLADLYDPLTMPGSLLKAHQMLDKAVDRCYRPQVFSNEMNRIEFLFELYEQYTAPLLLSEKKKKR